MHGDKSQRQREKALAALRGRPVDTLVATDVAARGIDVERHLARHQLRPARRPRRLRAPRRPHRPRRRNGVGITFVGAEQAKDVGRIATDLRLRTEFDAAERAAA